MASIPSPAQPSTHPHTVILHTALLAPSSQPSARAGLLCVPCRRRRRRRLCCWGQPVPAAKPPDPAWEVFELLPYPMTHKQTNNTSHLPAWPGKLKNDAWKSECRLWRTAWVVASHQHLFPSSCASNLPLPSRLQLSQLYFLSPYCCYSQRTRSLFASLLQLEQLVWCSQHSMCKQRNTRAGARPHRKGRHFGMDGCCCIHSESEADLSPSCSLPS